MTHRYISSSTHTPKCRRVCKRKHSIGGPIPVKEASLVLARPCTPRRHRLQGLFSSFSKSWPDTGLIFLRFTICSLDPAVMRLAFGQLDRSLSLLEDGSESYKSLILWIA